MEDPFRPLQKNCDNSVPWPDQRSGWVPSQITANLPNNITHWGGPGSPTLRSPANWSFTSNWALGFEEDYMDNPGIVLYLGYLEATYIDLKEREFGPKRPIFMKHSYEISLLAPGEGLQNIHGCVTPFHESEELMKEIMLTSNTTIDKEERSILSVITEKRVIRRAYLNDTMVELKLDTCSMASVVMTEKPRISRILRIKRKLRIHSLFQDNSGQGSIDKERLEARDKERGKPGKDRSLASDDPRRGGKIRYSYKYEEERDQPNLAKQRIIRDLRKRVPQSPSEEWETDATIHKRGNASTIMWKNEASSTNFRHIPKITKDNPCKKDGATRKRL